MTPGAVDDAAALARTGAVATVAGWALCLAISLISVATNGAGGVELFAGVALALYPTRLALTRAADRSTGLVLGAMVPLFPALVLFQWNGADWQDDAHMLFFALIAPLAVLPDWRPLVLATLVTAGHHLAVTLINPAWGFSGGADIGRVLLHGTILSAEAAILVVINRKLAGLFAAQAAAAEELQHCAAAERSAAQERERAQTEAAAAQSAVLNQLGEGLSALAAGNLRQRIDPAALPESYRALATDYNRSVGQLEQVICAVEESARVVRTGSSEIAAAAASLAGRSEEQAASVDQIAHVVEAALGSARSTATEARRAAADSAGASELAVRGDEMSVEAAEAVDAIRESAGQIESIVDAIETLALQTRILALNASVEAARAGEAGRGFAVVASEVRTLAQRSSEAAGHIRGLVAQSGARIDAGARLMQDAREVLLQLASAVRAMNGAVTAIAGRAEAQAAALGAINGSIHEIDGTTQQTAAMLEETSAATKALNEEAERLRDSIGFFEGSGDARTVQTAAVAPMRRDRTRRAA